MPRLLGRSLLAATIAYAFSAESVEAQQNAPDSSAYPVVHLDSAQIQTLPLVRSAEIPSFLPGAIATLSYATAFRGTLSVPDFRVDGVPALNFTVDQSRLQLPASALRSVTASLAGTSAAYAKQAGVDYATARGGSDWQGYARGGTDTRMPGSIGNVRAEFGAAAPLAPWLRAVANISTQSAVRSEFNNYRAARLYRVAGIDTTISFQQTPGNVRDVVIPNFIEIDDAEIPASNWNELLGSARVDFPLSGTTEIFAAGHYSRLQDREPFGGGCGACSLFNPASQRAGRSTSSLFTIGLDQKVGTASTLRVRAARGSDETISGVLAAGREDRSTGFDLTAWDFLVDDHDFPIDDALIQRLLTNAPEKMTPFPESRIDLRTTTEFRLNPYATITGFATGGVVSGPYTYADESRLFGSAVLESNLGRHRLMLGAEGTAIDARFGTVGYISTFNMYVWKESPSVISAFAEDALDFGYGTLQVGVRADSYNPNTQYSRIPGYVVPEDMVDAERETVVLPRVALAVPVRKFTFRGTYGKYAHIPSLNEQFVGKNSDFFRFRNTNVNHEFSRPLDLVKVTSANLNAEFRPARGITLAVTGLRNETKNAVSNTRRSFEDPTNPGSTTFLTVPVNEFGLKASGVDATASYSTTPRFAARVGMTYEEHQLTMPSNLSILNATSNVTTVVALLQGQTPDRLGEIDATLALRARSPGEYLFGGELATEQSTWITRFDARIAKRVQVAGLNASVWIDGLRLLGSSIFEDHIEPGSVSSLVEAHRQTLGGGTISDNIDLASMATAGPGVRNEVDLYMLQKAEQRFGNGDGMFSAAEQQAAFGAAVQVQALSTTPLSQSRRIQVGLQIDF